jgi:hypothetical protein
MLLGTIRVIIFTCISPTASQLATCFSYSLVSIQPQRDSPITTAWTSKISCGGSFESISDLALDLQNEILNLNKIPRHTGHLC